MGRISSRPLLLLPLYLLEETEAVIFFHQSPRVQEMEGGAAMGLGFDGGARLAESLVLV